MSRAELEPTRPIKGRAKVDSRNRLIYEIEPPPNRVGATSPRAVTVDGVWALTSNHELTLTLRDTEDQDRRVVIFKGAVVQARAHALTFALQRGEVENRRTSQQFSLSGRWQADANNRVTFLVEHADGSEDRLTFQGGWEVGSKHELLYRYRQQVTRARRLVHEEHTLVFAGAWDVTKASRLVYRVEGSTDSVFEFRAALQSPSLLAANGRLVYQVGLALSGGRQITRRVALFGVWKLNRDLSLSFEVPYADGRLRTIQFYATYALTSRDRVAAPLQARDGKRLGLIVTFTRKLVKDAELFAQFEQREEERSVIGGVRVRF